MSSTTITLAVHVLIELAVIGRVLLRPHREPAARVAWVAVIAALPVLGILAYLLLGEVRLGRRRAARLRDVLGRLPGLAAATPGDGANLSADVPERFEPLFRVGTSISGFEPV